MQLVSVPGRLRRYENAYRKSFCLSSADTLNEYSLLICADFSLDNKAAVERMLILRHNLREAYLLKKYFIVSWFPKNSLEARPRPKEFRP